MKPAVVVWTYLALGILLLEDSQYVISYLNDYRMSEYDDPASFEVPFDFITSVININAVLSPVFIVAILFSMVGLAIKFRWSRVLSFVTLGSDALLMFVISIDMLFGDYGFPGEPVKLGDVVAFRTIAVVLMVSATSFLFLAYKIYSSKPLKSYLKKTQ